MAFVVHFGAGSDSVVHAVKNRESEKNVKMTVKNLIKYLLIPIL